MEIQKTRSNHITINHQFIRNLLDVRVRYGTDAASDHHLIVATMKIKLRSLPDSLGRPYHRFNALFLRDHRKQKKFNCEVKNKSEKLEGLLKETVANHWTGLQATWKTACTHFLRKKEKEHKESLMLETWKNIEERKELKQKINQCQESRKRKSSEQTTEK